MRFAFLALCFFFFSSQLFSQILSKEKEKKMIELYRNGTYALQNGYYKIADSLLAQSVRIKLNYDNYYNYSLARYGLGDTSTFCINMMYLTRARQEDAQKIYFSICAEADTTYYNRKFEKKERTNTRYYKVVEKNKFLPYKIVHLHDRSIWNKSNKGKYVPFGILNTIETNIIAKYLIYPENDTIFTFTDTPPLRKGQENDYEEQIEKIRSIQRQAINDLGLNQISVQVDLIINKQGKIIDHVIGEIDPSVKDHDKFRKYIDQIVKNCPPYSPAQFRGEKVTFKKLLMIRF